MGRECAHSHSTSVLFVCLIYMKIEEDIRKMNIRDLFTEGAEEEGVFRRDLNENKVVVWQTGTGSMFHAYKVM